MKWLRRKPKVDGCPCQGRFPHPGVCWLLKETPVKVSVPPKPPRLP